MDTGVSPDSYAIIELGMVDEILNDRDHSRRKLFEQAAGVSKYKKRKKETIDKLKSTDADLERVKDLLFEIEGQLKTLEKQAAKTKKFYELKEEYKNLSLILAKFSLQEYKQSFKDLEAKRQIQDDKKLEIETAIKTAEAALEKEKLDNVDKEKNLMEIQRRLNTLVSGVSERENERNLLNSSLKFAHDKLDTAQKQIIDANDHIEKLKLSIDKLTIDLNAESSILDGKKSELAILEEALNETRSHHTTIKESLSTEQKAYAEKERQIFELEKKLAVNRSNNESLQRELSQSEEDTISKRKELEELQKQLEQYKLDQEKTDHTLKQLIADEESRKQQISDLELSVEKTRQELTQEARTLDAKKNEYELTKSLVENLEGFPESIKFLKKNAKWSKDAPLLSDIIYCAEEHRVAIENYLEPYLNYYVVQNIEEAIMAVNLLKDSSMGRANFFILDDIQAYENKSSLSIPNAVPATDLVEMDAQYAKLEALLLDRVFMVDDSSGFNNSQLNTNGQKIVLLTKTGHFIRQDFTLSGGAVGLFEGKKIGRAKNLEKLKEEIEKLERVTYQLHSRVSDTVIKINQLKSSTQTRQIDEQRNTLNQFNNKFSATQASIQSLIKFLESSDAKSKNITERLQQLNVDVENINKELVELREVQTVSKQALEQTDKEFIDFTNRLSEASSRFNQKNIEFHQQQNRVNSISQELNFKNSQVESFTAQLTRNNEIITECNFTIEENQTKLKEIESILLEGYANKEAIEKEVADSEKSYYDSRGGINELDGKIRELTRSRDAVNVLISEISDRFNELKLNLTGMRERLSVEFNVNVNDIINEELDPKWNKDEITEDHVKIKKRIEGFGEINPMAVEAYNEMKERYDFIIVQKKDLEDAKTSLLDTIKEIDDTAKTQFLEAFYKVRDSFIKVFRTLFSEEDQCDLYLVNPEDPLESKIEIIAKPKGKRPTVIDQLSGGEKTLTATALLFSLYLLKPAPFCIFDEVDAPLDDTNITKFNKIIQEFSGDSQFIIVTHNKQTMSAVESIYGVTMVEQGVSRVVPVNFSSLN